MWKEEEKSHHRQNWEIELCVEAQRLKAPEGNSYSCLTTQSELQLQCSEHQKLTCEFCQKYVGQPYE